MSEYYELRLYDTVLLSFEMPANPPAGTFARIIEVHSPHNLLPLDLELSGEGLMKWMKRRTIPKNRAYVQNILNSMGLSNRDTKGIIDMCKGLSLNDSYWIVPKGFDGKFAEYNLYENRFSQVLALTALTGESLSPNEARKIRTSPEFTTNGMLPKAWRYKDGEIILFKGGVWRQYANTPDPLEPYSEFYAAQIADAMGLNPVKYGLSRWKGMLGSTCKLFTDINTAFVPMSAVIRGELKEAEPQQYYTICGEWFKAFNKKSGTNLYDYFASILVFDSVILNEDRHLGNFGVMRDNRNGKIIGVAPIFDNGISLFNYSSIQELRRIDTHRQAYLNYFQMPFELQVKEFGGEKQKEQLERLLNFKFKKHSRYNLDAERLDFLQKYTRERAGELLNIICAHAAAGC
jgi:hypothetical protein